MSVAPAPAERLPPKPAETCGAMERVDVQCNGNIGTLLITTQAIVCKCSECTQSPCSVQRGGRVMTPTEFERHSGMQNAKKWRRSIKVVDACKPGMSIGRWLEVHGFSIEDGKEVRTEEAPPPPPQMQLPAHMRQQHQQVDFAERPVQLHVGSSPFQRSSLDRTLSSQASLFHFGLPTISPRQLHARLHSAHLHAQQSHEFPPQLPGLNKADSSKDSDTQFYEKSSEAARTARSSHPGVTSAPGPSSASAMAAASNYGNSKNNHRNPRSSNNRSCIAEEDVLLAADALELLKSAPSLEPVRGSDEQRDSIVASERESREPLDSHSGKESNCARHGGAAEVYAGAQQPGQPTTTCSDDMEDSGHASPSEDAKATRETRAAVETTPRSRRPQGGAYPMPLMMCGMLPAPGPAPCHPGFMHPGYMMDPYAAHWAAAATAAAMQQHHHHRRNQQQHQQHQHQQQRCPASGDSKVLAEPGEESAKEGSEEWEPEQIKEQLHGDGEGRESKPREDSFPAMSNKRRRMVSMVPPQLPEAHLHHLMMMAHLAPPGTPIGRTGMPARHQEWPKSAGAAALRGYPMAAAMSPIGFHPMYAAHMPVHTPYGLPLSYPPILAAHHHLMRGPSIKKKFATAASLHQASSGELAPAATPAVVA